MILRGLVAISVLVVASFWSCKETSEENKQASLPAMKAITTPASKGSSLSRMTSDGNKLYLSWVAKKDALHTLYYASFDGLEWSKTIEVVSGSDWFVNWADFPVIAVQNESILTTYLRKSDTATYAYDIRYNYFDKQNNDWKKGLLLHSDSTKTEHGFVSVAPSGEDMFDIAWLDGRFTAGHAHGASSSMEKGAMTLRGATVLPDGTIINSTQLDSRVCDCCQTSMATTNNYTWVAYRDRSEREIRDISIVRKHRHHGWSDPMPVSKDGWKIAGCPVNGPSIDSFQNTVALAWFTAPEGEGVVKVAFASEEDGFGSAFRVDNGNATGRVNVVLEDPYNAWVLWMEPEGEKEVIRLANITSEGEKRSEIKVAEISPERASGFPQLQYFQEKLYVSYTDLSSEAPQIKLTVIPLS